MALVFHDRVQETSTTTGTGSYTLNGPDVSFQAFSVIGDGNTCHYVVTDGTDWESGLGTYTLAGNTLARTTIYESSNAGAAVNWPAGSKSILIAPLATFATGYYAHAADTDIHLDRTVNEAISGMWRFAANGTGDITDYDVQVGDATPNYGIIRVGSALLGRTSHTAVDGPPLYNLDGTMIFENPAGPVTGDIEFAFLDSAGLVRFALPRSAVGNATFNPRSMIIAGPAVADSDEVTLAYWQTQGIFHNLTMDTVTNGADLGIQNDLEVEGTIYTDSITESTPAAGITFGVSPNVGGNALLDAGDIGVTVQGYDANTAKTDVNEVITGAWTFNDNVDTLTLFNATGTVPRLILENTGPVSGSRAWVAPLVHSTTGDLEFWTAADGGAVQNRRMYITRAGVMYVNNNEVLDTTDIGVTVQGYDVDTAKLDTNVLGDFKNCLTGDRTLSTTANQYVELFSLSRSSGAFSFILQCTVSDSGFSVAKTYAVSVFYNGTTGSTVYEIVRPIADSGPYGANDFRIELDSTLGLTTVRAARVGGATAGSISFELWVGDDAAAVTVNVLTGTGTSTATADYNPLDADTVGGIDPTTILVDGDIGSTVQGYDADTAKKDEANTWSLGQTFTQRAVFNAGIELGNTDIIYMKDTLAADVAVLRIDSSDIVSLRAASGGFQVEDSSAVTKLSFNDGTGTFDFKGIPTTLGNAILDAGDIGVTVQAYDVDTAKRDVGQTFTGTQTFNAIAQAIQVLSGDQSTTYEGAQIRFGYSTTTSYSHAIGTRHNAGAQTNNAIDFYIWNQGTDAAGTRGTFRAFTIDRLRVDSLVPLYQESNLVLDTADIGVSVQAYDATYLVDADIGVTVQGYDVDTLKADVSDDITGIFEFQSYLGFSGASGNGIRFWNSNSAYTIHMSSQGDATWGGRLDTTSDYNTYFRQGGGTNRGFVFQNGTTELAQFDGSGNFFLTNTMRTGPSATGNVDVIWQGRKGTAFWKSFTDQGGISFGSDSSMILYAGDHHDAYGATKLNLPVTTTGETLYLLADSSVQILSNCQTFGSRYTYTFSAAGGLSVPGQITQGGLNVYDTGDAATGNTANKLVLRDANGDHTSRYVNGTYMNMSHSASTRNSDTVFYSSTDNYIRKNNATGFRTSLGIANKAGTETITGTWTWTQPMTQTRSGVSQTAQLTLTGTNAASGAEQNSVIKSLQDGGGASSARTAMTFEINSVECLRLNDFTGNAYFPNGDVHAKNFYPEVVSLTGTNVDADLGGWFYKTISANTTLTFSSVLNTQVVSFYLELTNAGAYTITWPTSVDWEEGFAPTLTSSGKDILAFMTRDGGTTWHGFVVAFNSK